MVTVTYELAQRMKDNGWEQETEFYYRQSLKKEPRHRDNIVEFVDLDVFIPAPTADEIAEALKDIPYVFLDRSVHDGVRYGYATEGGKAYLCKSTTIAEALGELWCKIQEDK